jgi:hypothetical protein
LDGRGINQRIAIDHELPSTCFASSGQLSKPCKRACRLAHDRQGYRTGLGAAQYRAGLYREAIATLGGAEPANKCSPAVLAFLAMAHYQLGQREQAQAILACLRELLDQPRWAKDAETQDLVHEAQALVGPTATTER